MEHTAGPVAVTLVSPDGRLEALARTLREHAPTIAVDVVDQPAAIERQPDPTHATRTEAPDCIVVCHDSDVDGVDQLEAVVDRVGSGIPVVVFSLVNELEPVGATLRAGAADILCVGTDYPALIERRLRSAAGVGTPLQPPEQRLESLLEYLPHQVFLKDDEHRIIDVSRVTAEEYELTREQMVGLTDFELFQPELAAELFEEELRIMNTGESVINKTEHYVDRQGRDRWVRTSKAARYDDDGNVVGVLGSSRDVTKTQRQKLILNVLHEASRDLVSATTGTDIADVAADIAADIPDLPRLCIALTTDGHLEMARGTESVFDRYRDAFERTHRESQTRLLDDDGTTTTLGDDAAVVLLPLGSHGVLGFETTSEELDAFSVDLARILAANIEVALDRAEREARLEAQNERLEQFASIASHDLRNPMATAEGYLEAYRESGDPAHADEIEAALDRMDRLTDDLLELARHGRIVDSVEAIDLVAVVERAWGSVPTDDAVLDLGADLEGTTYGDAERVQEALENLFRNTVEHGHTSANDEVCVRVERLRNGIAVSDDGPGIPDSKKGEVFDLGYTDSTDGTGYGLYIVDQIVTAHDWSIRVTDAEDGGGARFEITGLEFDD